MMKTLGKRRGFVLGVEDSSFFPRARKAEERLRAGLPPEESSEKPQRKDISQFIPGQPAPAAQEHPESMRPGYQPRDYPKIEFNVPEMWGFVDQTVRTPGYTGRPFLVKILTPPTQGRNEEERHQQAIGQIAQYFGIPAANFEGYTIDQAWTNVIGPMFQEFEMIMNRMKPAYIPGTLRFQLSPLYELEVGYWE